MTLPRTTSAEWSWRIIDKAQKGRDAAPTSSRLSTKPSTPQAKKLARNKRTADDQQTHGENPPRRKKNKQTAKNTKDRGHQSDSDLQQHDDRAPPTPSAPEPQKKQANQQTLPTDTQSSAGSGGPDTSLGHLLDLRRSLDGWKAELADGLKRYRRARLPNYLTQSQRGEPFKLDQYEALSSDDVVVCIASFWLALYRSSINFTFGTPLYFDVVRENGLETHSDRRLNDSDQFLIPIFIDGDRNVEGEDVDGSVTPGTDSEKQETQKTKSKGKEKGTGKRKGKGKAKNFSKMTVKQRKKENHKQMEEQALKNHIVLVVASKQQTSPSSEPLIHLTYYDSYTGAVAPTIIRRVARNMVRHSRWLDHAPTFDTSENWIAVSQQRGATCGVHTILNTFAYMLGIDVHYASYQPMLHEDDYEEGLRVLKLVLAGRGDGRLVMAFMQVHGLAVPRDYDDWVDGLDELERETDVGGVRVGNVRSEWMSVGVLDNFHVVPRLNVSMGS